jgi:plasmid stabilization system protein ParE
MKIAYSPRAVADIASIANYLTERSSPGALAVEQRIREVLDRLAEFPGMGRELVQRPRSARHAPWALSMSDLLHDIGGRTHCSAHPACIAETSAER